MRSLFRVLAATLALAIVHPPSALLAAPAAARNALALHPENPSYLSFRGKATVLVGSGEHYGAVVNLDFDTRRY
ncbi:MAG TPA: hypothetical protein VE359_05550, partial [Vicinamibacteria bacterium]|nr:hypothetical protein [Vicinamibacteria bacterium]